MCVRIPNGFAQKEASIGPEHKTAEAGLGLNEAALEIRAVAREDARLR
jgi:hypothetical protein